jgi:hypothetical protein
MPGAGNEDYPISYSKAPRLVVMPNFRPEYRHGIQSILQRYTVSLCFRIKDKTIFTIHLKSLLYSRLGQKMYDTATAIQQRYKKLIFKAARLTSAANLRCGWFLISFEHMALHMCCSRGVTVTDRHYQPIKPFRSKNHHFWQTENYS